MVLQQNGFGGLDFSYYWLGLDRINALTKGGNFKLRVELEENVTGLWYSAEYLHFQVDNATSLYAFCVNYYEISIVKLPTYYQGGLLGSIG